MRCLSIFVVMLCFAFIGGCGRGVSTPGGQNAATVGRIAEKDRAEEIVAEYLRRDAAPFRKNRVRFTISEEGGPNLVYEIDTWRKQTPGATSTFTRIVKPIEDSGLGSLTLEPAGQSASVVTWSNSQKQFRESDTRKMFFGGLTAGELLGEWNKYSYKFLSEMTVDSIKAFEVEGRLKSGSDSMVQRMIVTFRGDNYLPVRLELFGAEDKKLRTINAVQIGDPAGRPYNARVEVQNHIYNTRIVIEQLSNEFPASIPDAIFDRERLKEGALK